MAVSQPPVKVANSDNYFNNSEKFSEVFPVSIKDGSDLISLIIAGKDAPSPQAHPKLVKDELLKKILNQWQIENLNVTRQRKLIPMTKDILTAQELHKVDSFLGIPVDTFVQTKYYVSLLTQIRPCYHMPECCIRTYGIGPFSP